MQKINLQAFEAFDTNQSFRKQNRYIDYNSQNLLQLFLYRTPLITKTKQGSSYYINLNYHTEKITITLINDFLNYINNPKRLKTIKAILYIVDDTHKTKEPFDLKDGFFFLDYR